MIRYELNPLVKRKKLLHSGFKYSYDGTYTMERYLYKKSISLLLTVYMSSDEPWMQIRVIDNYNGSAYPLHSEYGKSDVRNIANKKYKNIMRILVKKGIVKKTC